MTLLERIALTFFMILMTVFALNLNYRMGEVEENYNIINAAILSSAI